MVTEYLGSTIFWEDDLNIQKNLVDRIAKEKDFDPNKSQLTPNFGAVVLWNYITKTVPGLFVTPSFETFSENETEKGLVQEAERFVLRFLKSFREFELLIFLFLFDFYLKGRGVMYTTFDKDKFYVQRLKSEDVLLGYRNGNLEWGSHCMVVNVADFQRSTGFVIPRDKRIRGKDSFASVRFYYDMQNVYFMDEDATDIYGFSENPFGCIPYVPAVYLPYETNFGKSLILQHLNLNEEYAFRLSDLSDNARQTVSEEAVLKTDNQKTYDDVRNRRAENTIHKIGREDDMSVLQRNYANPDMSLLLREVKEQVYIESGLSGAIIGQDTKSLQGKSGVALQFLFMPIMERISFAHATLSPAFELLFARIADFGLSRGKIKAVSDPWMITAVYNPLIPADRSRDIADCVQAINAGFMSRETAMQRCGIDDVEAEMARIERERLLFDSGISPSAPVVS